MFHHYIKKCSCGNVISQCKCIRIEKKVIVEEKGCDVCRGENVLLVFTGNNGEFLDYQVRCAELIRGLNVVNPHSVGDVRGFGYKPAFICIGTWYEHEWIKDAIFYLGFDPREVITELITSHRMMK